MDLLVNAKSKVFPWIRLNRVIRDIPNTEIYGGNSNISMRDYLKTVLKQQGKTCDCIRCREIKNKKLNKDNIKLVIRKYNDNNADEYFISYESKDKKIIYGFCRLRLNKTNDYIHLNLCAHHHYPFAHWGPSNFYHGILLVVLNHLSWGLLNF